MQITGPTPLTFVPPSNTVVVNSVVVDMRAKTYSVNYGDPSNMTSKTASGPIPPALYAGMAANCQHAIEVNEGWPLGSTTPTTPEP